MSAQIVRFPTTHAAITSTRLRLRGKAPPASTSKDPPAPTMAESTAARQAMTCAAAGCDNTSATTTGNQWVKGGTTYWRCHPCVRQAKRLHDAVSSLSSESQTKWKKATKADRDGFKERNKDALAPDLRAALELFVTEAFARFYCSLIFI